MRTETYIYITEAVEGIAYEGGIGRTAYDGYDYETGAEDMIESDG